MKLRIAIVLAAMPLALCLPGCNSDDTKSTAEAPLTYQESVEATVTARVRAINHSTRVMTLEDSSNHWMTFVVDDKVKRLNEVKVGDDVKAQYRADLLAELRPPTAAESANPITVTESHQRASSGAAPSRTTTQTATIVTTVDAVDLPRMRVTLRGPMGDVAVVRAKKEENIKKLRVGDTIVVTLTEMVAVSLDKVAPR